MTDYTLSDGYSLAANEHSPTPTVVGEHWIGNDLYSATGYVDLSVTDASGNKNDVLAGQYIFTWQQVSTDHIIISAVDSLDGLIINVQGGPETGYQVNTYYNVPGKLYDYNYKSNTLKLIDSICCLYTVPGAVSPNGYSINTFVFGWPLAEIPPGVVAYAYSASIISNTVALDYNTNIDELTNYYGTVKYYPVELMLFSLDHDSVDFNNLDQFQQLAIQTHPSNIYLGFGGNDVVTLPNVANYNEDVGGGKTLNWNSSLTFSTGSTSSDNYHVFGGDGDYKIRLGAGTDTVDISGAGSNQIWVGSGSADITVNAAGKNTIFLGSAPDSVLDTVHIKNLSTTPNTTIDQLDGKETLELVGVQANESVFDESTGILKLYNTIYGKYSDLVGEIQFKGDYADSSFYLHPNSELTIGNPPPTVLELAEMAKGVYDFAPTVGDYNAIAVRPNTNGFLAIAYARRDPVTNSPDQIVIAIRGTYKDEYSLLLKNLIADASFLGSSNDLLSAYVSSASGLLYDLRKQYPTASFTFTGHSLGGAVAGLVADAAKYPAATFDAPGAHQLKDELAPALALAEQSSSMLSETDALPYNSELDALIVAYRLQGDQISLVGDSIGKVETILNPDSLGWVSAFPWNHSIDKLIVNLQTQPIQEGVPDSPLPNLIMPSFINPRNGLILSSFVEIAVDAGVPIPFDPAGASSYEMIGSTGSPAITSLTLPYDPNIASYNVKLLTDAGWSQVVGVTPGQTFTPGAAFTGFAFTPLNANGNPVNMSSSVVFDMTFDSAGQFSGELTALLPPSFNPVDVSGNGTSDLMWQRGSKIVAMFTNGAGGFSGLSNELTPDAGFELVGSGQVDGLPGNELIFASPDEGVEIGVPQGTSSGFFFTKVDHPGTGWAYWQAADMSGDGRSDLVWRYGDDLGVTLLDASGAKISDHWYSSPGGDWAAVAAVDLNGDANTDILWRSASLGGALASTLTNPSGTGFDSANWLRARTHKVVGLGAMS